MNHIPKIASRSEWLQARRALLEEEKALTRKSDELARRRMELPWVKIDKAYRFDTERGEMNLADLFAGRTQLIIYHFMFGPDFQAGCPSCSSLADCFNGVHVHLSNHDVMFWAVSTAPLSKLIAYRNRLGWSFPWASSGKCDFNLDFNVQITEEMQRHGGAEYNYQKEPVFVWRPSESGGGVSAVAQFAATCGVDVPTFHRDRPGMSAFVLHNDEVFHTYSAFARGLDSLWTVYQWLDRAPLGRNETSPWMRRNDEY